MTRMCDWSRPNRSGFKRAACSPDPVQAISNCGEDAADVLAQRIERIEIIEDAGEAVFDLALALAQRVDARDEGKLSSPIRASMPASEARSGTRSA